MNWQGKRVFVTGHTGFKGSWLSLWLQKRGAIVRGYALDPPTSPSLFEAAAVSTGMDSVAGDIRDLARLGRELQAFHPEIVMHLAAQSLVRLSYSQPIETYTVNVLGTAHLLEAVRATNSVRAVVIVTTDKCYENREWLWAYREIDPLGGHDPYSSSKAAAELVTSSYRNSYFAPQHYAAHGVAVATVRAGNVIGGGDWAQDRLIPDMIRSFQAGEPVSIRHPEAVRPWQHVLEPVRGYLMLAEALFDHGPSFGEAWNFGPNDTDALPVKHIVERLTALWSASSESAAEWKIDSTPRVHEANHLRLDCSKAAARLGWRPLLSLNKALELTAAWYTAAQEAHPMQHFTLNQIDAYERLILQAAHPRSTPSGILLEETV